MAFAAMTADGEWICVRATFRRRVGKRDCRFAVRGAYRAEPESVRIDWATQEHHEDDVLRERELREFGLWGSAWAAIRRTAITRERMARWRAARRDGTMPVVERENEAPRGGRGPEARRPHERGRAAHGEA